MQRRGYSRYFAYKVFQMQWDDLLHNHRTTLGQKLWAYKRGFLSYRIEMYGLTEENYKNYLSDFDYYKLHPINGIFNRWIDDKYLFKLILQNFSEYLPKYFFHIGNGEILPLLDCPDQFEPTLDGVIALLKSERALAAKQFSGSSGAGFIKLSCVEGIFQIGELFVSERDIRDLIEQFSSKMKGGYLVTEYIRPCQELSRIWDKTANTVRISVLREKGQPPSIFSAYIRFGTEKTGSVDNSSSGGITCIIDLDTGFFHDGRIIEKGQNIHCEIHPDSKVFMEGTIPQWEFVKRKILEICAYLPQLVLMGMDVVITEAGFKIIEINSHGTFGYNQAYLPLLSNEMTKNFFKEQLRRIR